MSIQETLIPKIFHFIWLGSERYDKMEENIQSWQKTHPDWNFCFWTDQSDLNIKNCDIKNVKELFPFSKQDVYDTSSAMAYKSDILRLEILRRFGGVYVDIDFVSLKSINQTISGLKNFTCYSTNMITNGIFGAIPESPWIIKMLNMINGSRWSGPDVMNRITGGFPNVSVFEDWVFYPVDFNGLEVNLKGESLAKHLWKKSWIKEDFPNVTFLTDSLPHEKISLIVTIDQNTELFPHFLSYYRKLGVKRFLVGIKDTPNNDLFVNEIKQYGDDVFVVAKMTRFDSTGCELINSIIKKHNSDWFLIPDLDEFQEFPLELNQLVENLESVGCNCVVGRLVDRITSDGKIPDRLTSDDIMSQFSVPVLFSEKIMKQACSKVMLVNKNVGVDGEKEIPYSKKAIVWRIKWFGNIRNRLEQILAFREEMKLPWKEEMLNALEHLHNNNGGICRRDLEFTGSKGNKKGILLLTAALNVLRESHIIKDKNERLIQYIHSLLMWASTDIKDIVFCENSGFDYDLSECVKIVEQQGCRIELLLFKNERHTEDYGILEHAILKHIFDHSLLLKEHSTFYKATGRLFVENANDIFSHHSNDTNLFNLDPLGLDVRFFKMACEDFRNWVFGADQEFEKNIMEHVFHKVILNYKTFKCKPVFVGRSGYFGRIYDRDYYPDAMETSRELARKVMPFVKSKIIPLR